MQGIWVLVIESLIALVFLVRNRAVAGFLSRLSRQPRHTQLVVLLVAAFATLRAVEKSTNETEMVTFEQVIEQPLSLILQTSSLSSWWQEDDTDTDEDGIPDLWEKWTHGNRTVADGGIDRDNDGLTDLEEFQNQTDPRTADTDGDGFSDFFEVSNGMNPVSAEDFTVVEPDSDNDGFPDLCENAGYGICFHDADSDGFDDIYEANLLPTTSDENFDVLLDVYTTRSAALTWESGEDWCAIVVPPTNGVPIRLRLPFGVDTALSLQPAPNSSEPPSGELWKARMRLSFVPREGQHITGNALVSSDSQIAHKIVELESVIERFPTSLPSGFQTLALGGEGSDTPRTDIKAGRFEVYCDDVYHTTGDIVGLVVTNQSGMGSVTFGWRSAYGDMDPNSGLESELTIERLPTLPDEKVTVVTTASLDGETDVDVTTVVEKCAQEVFSAGLSANNFSPHLFETNWIVATVPGCGHIFSPGWLEIEVMRETLGGNQHVAYVDLDPLTATLDRYLDTSAFGGQTLSFPWDGIAQASLPLAYYDEIFTNGTRNFNLAAPAVAADDPVPPPFHTVAVRLWNAAKTETLHEYTRTIFVPQVVQVRWEIGAETLFRTPKAYVSPAGLTTNIYSADYAGDSGALLQETLTKLRAYYPSTVNIRFVPFFSADIDTTKFLLITPDIRKKIVVDPDRSKREVYVYGLTSPATLQQSATGLSSCYLGSACDSTLDLYTKYAKSNGTVPQPFPIPVSSSQMLDAICKVSAHEVGHALGLVDTYYLGGMGEKHNPGADDQSKMMNVNTDLSWFFNTNSGVGWQELNSQYLEFVLPIPK